MAYARTTKVAEDRSRNEIEKLVTKAGGINYGYATTQTFAIFQFEIEKRTVRFRVPLPDRKEFPYIRRGRKVPGYIDEAAFEQERRRRFRALLLVIKAKLESRESKIETFEDAFLAQIVMPGGHTVSELLGDKIDAAYKSGKVGPLLLGPGSGDDVIEANTK